MSDTGQRFEPAETPGVIILLGPPGSGKTVIGTELSAQYGFRFRDYEAFLVEKYGPLELFVNHKKQAVKEVHEAILASISEVGPPVVLETTALSERKFIDDLIKTYTAFTVLLEVAAETALDRILERPRGRNLSNDPGTNRLIIERFAEAHGERQVDLRINTEDVSVVSAARMISNAVQTLGQS